MHHNALAIGLFTLSLVLGIFSKNAAAAEPVPDAPFWQEYREFLKSDLAAANDVRGIAVDGSGSVWTATAAGIFKVAPGGLPEAMQSEADAGPAFAAESAPDGSVWFGAWNGLYQTTPEGDLTRMEMVMEPIGAVGFHGDRVVAMGPKGMWIRQDGVWQKHVGTWANTASQIAFDTTGDFWVATGHGLFQLDGPEVKRHLYGEHELVTGDQKTVVFAPDGTLWCGGFGGLDVYSRGARMRSYTSRQGLPHSDVRKIAFHPDGTPWVCTALGVARLRGDTWSLRHSMRWLPSDDTRDVVFDEEGTAYVATAAGVAVIRRRFMTLAEKAEHYYQILLERKVRDPWIVGISRLMKQGDVSTSLHEDEDNDGEYTNHYLAMEAFRYLVTRDETALERARKAMETMELFQTVTSTSGFIARTIVPPDWASPDTPNPNRLHDRNRSYTEREIAEIQVRDPRMKPVEERWRPSEDGKWLWKGDTSSDEICGHFFGYYIFYEYVAQTDEERRRVAELARRVMDYMIDGGYNLRDTDGTPTRWGVWNPDTLLNNGDWRAERPVNATEILAFLKTTAYLTGDEKYEREYRRLIDEYGFLEFARAPKPIHPAERTDIDSSLLALVFPALLGIEKDEDLRAAYREGLHQWFGQVKNDHNPFFNFICGAYGVEAFNAEACVAFLRDAPLDLIYWTVDNREREDLKLVRYPELYNWQVDRLLPPSERYTMRWDKNPYDAVGGFDGYRESTGVYWLLPYWMGRYHGFIGPAE